MSGIIWYLSFCDWLISLSSFLRFNCAAQLLRSFVDIPTVGLQFLLRWPVQLLYFTPGEGEVQRRESVFLSIGPAP